MLKVKIFLDFFVNFSHLATQTCRYWAATIFRWKIFMSNSYSIVSVIFEEMAEEENLFSAGRASFLAGQYSTINETQIKILEGIILSRAERLHCSPLLLREEFIDAYRIDDLSDLPHNRFEDAVLHLARFIGVN